VKQCGLLDRTQHEAGRVAKNIGLGLLAELFSSFIGVDFATIKPKAAIGSEALGQPARLGRHSELGLGQMLISSSVNVVLVRIWVGNDQDFCCG
jgi:hypothetical protein